MTFEEIRSVLASGGGLTVDATKFSFEQLQTLAANAAIGKTHLVLHLMHGGQGVHGGRIGFAEMRTIAASGEGHVSFTPAVP